MNIRNSADNISQKIRQSRRRKHYTRIKTSEQKQNEKNKETKTCENLLMALAIRSCSAKKTFNLMNTVESQGQGGKNQEEKWKQNKKNTEKAEKKENLEAEGDCECGNRTWRRRSSANRRCREVNLHTFVLVFHVYIRTCGRIYESTYIRYVYKKYVYIPNV